MTTRRLAAILAADVVGYSRLMGADEGPDRMELKGRRRGHARAPGRNPTSCS
jgi:hypothetical protein